MSQVLEKFQLSVSPFRQDGSAERLHDLLDGHILVGELVAGGAGASQRDDVSAANARSQRRKGQGHRRESREIYQTSPNAPIPTGCRSEYLEVISKVVPKICALMNSAIFMPVFGRIRLLGKGYGELREPRRNGLGCLM